ncbi:MAG: 2-oxoacid:acceptor oxidoreductase family protein [Thermodesulfobacteriota bacterium]|nr:2-oxoacid:acceptor oxidoreductase family protein [Thermodesulfobacteriota bacterium]
MGNLKQIRICGFGGQGVVLAGTILGHAAINDGKWVSGSNAYGAQARGGSARSEIIISKNPIKYPHVIRADILIAMSQTAYDDYIKDVAEKVGIVIYDNMLVNPVNRNDIQQVGVPATNTAISELNNKQVSNIVMLCASTAITEMVSKQAVITSIKNNVEKRFMKLNLKALEVGYNVGEELR